MVDQNLLEDAWAKARTLKAVDDLGTADPDRALLTDMLQAVYAVSPYGKFDAESHGHKREIFAHLTGEESPEFYREFTSEVVGRDFLLTKLMEISVDFAKGSRLYGSQEDVAVEMQHRIKHADPGFQQWLGNPFGEADIPTPRWLEEVQAERVLAL